jgi:hypothetical protein
MAEAVDALAEEKMLGTPEDLLAAVEAIDNHDSLTTPPSKVSSSDGGVSTTSLETLVAMFSRAGCSRRGAWGIVPMTTVCPDFPDKPGADTMSAVGVAVSSFWGYSRTILAKLGCRSSCEGTC